jgi:hypothetical protein
MIELCWVWGARGAQWGIESGTVDLASTHENFYHYFTTISSDVKQCQNGNGRAQFVVLHESLQPQWLIKSFFQFLFS